MMTTETEMREAAEKAYLTALLLSGSAEAAEASVLKGIRSLNPASVSGEQLFHTAVRAAVKPTEPGPAAVESGPPSPSHLPAELRSVVDLARYPRQCFVLCILVGLPRETCARLLHSDIEQVDEGTYAALSELPALSSYCSR